MKLGDEILRCEPFSHVVLSKLQTSVCDACLKRTINEERFKRCSGCKHVHYCDTNCQRKSWSNHREECAYLKAVAPKVPPDTVRLIARIILKLLNGGLRETAVLPDGSKRSFEDLMSHQKNIVNDSKRLEAFEAFYEVLKECLGSRLPPKSEVLDVYGRILINAFSINDNENQTIGIGIFLAASVLDHSCKPNATVVFKGTQLIVRCISKNFNGDFSQVRITYTNQIDPTKTRQLAIKDRYYFDCTCELCSDENNPDDLLKQGAIICGKCSSHVATFLIKGCCTQCSFSLSEVVQLHRVLRDEAERYIEEFEKNKETVGYDKATTLYVKMKEMFSWYDKVFIDILENAFEDSIGKQKWDLAYETSKILLLSYQRLYPEYDTNTALTLTKLGKIACYLDELKEAQDFLVEAMRIAVVTHGPCHPMSCDIIDPLLKEVQLLISHPSDIPSLLNE